MGKLTLQNLIGVLVYLTVGAVGYAVFSVVARLSWQPLPRDWEFWGFYGYEFWLWLAGHEGLLVAAMLAGVFIAHRGAWRAAFIGAGILAAWLLAQRLSGPAAGILVLYVPEQPLVTLILYVVGIVLGAVVGWALFRKARRAAFIGAGILAAWLLAQRLISGTAAGILAPHVPAQPLVTMALYVAGIVVGAVIGWRLYNRLHSAENRALLRLLTLDGTLWRWGIGLALGVIFMGTVTMASARTAFDVAPRDIRWALLDSMRSSSIAPIQIRALRQLAGPGLTSRSFDFAIDDIDRSIFLVNTSYSLERFVHSSFLLIRDMDAISCALLDKEGQVVRFGSGEACAETSANAVWWPAVTNQLSVYNLVYESYHCTVDTRLGYWGILFTNNERTCGVLQRKVIEEGGWPLTVESLPLPLGR